MSNSKKQIRSEKNCRNLTACSPTLCLFFASLALNHSAVAAQTTDKEDEAVAIQPGDQNFNTPEFGDYQAVYTSSSSKTGGFTLQARKSGDGKKLAIIDIIPMPNFVIVAQRQIDLKTHRTDFGAGPFFAWGQEFVVSNSDGSNYSWTRNPIGPGSPKQMQGAIANGGYVSEMFSPTLASLMPMPIGSQFRLPAAYPRKGEFVSSEYDQYQVLRKEQLSLSSGFSCECWMIEKKTWNGMTEHIWVSREAPFVYRRIRDVGGKREFQSDLLAYTQLTL